MADNIDAGGLKKANSIPKINVEDSDGIEDKGLSYTSSSNVSGSGSSSGDSGDSDLIVPAYTEVMKSAVLPAPYNGEHRSGRPPLLKDCSKDSGMFSVSVNSHDSHKNEKQDHHHIKPVIVHDLHLEARRNMNELMIDDEPHFQNKIRPKRYVSIKKCGCCYVDDIQIIMVTKMVCWVFILLFGCLALDYEIQNDNEETEFWHFSVNGYVAAVGFITLVVEIITFTLYSLNKLNFDLKCLVATLILYNVVVIMCCFAIIAIWFPMPLYGNISNNYIRTYIVFAAIAIWAGAYEISNYVDDIRRLSSYGCWAITEGSMSMCSGMIIA